MTNTNINIYEIREELNTGDYGEFIADYHGGYISEVIFEIADNNTSIYYCDIMEFISGNPQSLADVIDEGLFDPSHDYDLYRHGQAAEFLTIECDIYNHLDDVLMCYCINYIKKNYKAEDITSDLYEAITEKIAERPDELEELNEIIDDYFNN